MTPEAKVKQGISKLFDALGIDWETPIGSVYGKSNRLDFTCCVPSPHGGRYLAVEAKATAQSEIQPRQLKKIAAVHKAGGAALVIHADNMDELVACVARLMEVTIDDIELLVRASHAQTKAARSRPRRTIQAG